MIFVFQMETTYVTQGLHMRLSFDDRNDSSAATDEPGHFQVG